MKPPVALVAPVEETAAAEVELADVPFEFDEPEPLTHWPTTPLMLATVPSVGATSVADSRL